MTIIGIDPGKNGAIAWITDGKPCVEKMPETLTDLWELIQDIFSAELATPRKPGDHGVKAYLEQVNAGAFASKEDKSRRMGVKSAFTFGNGFGHLEMALTASFIPFERIRPQVWQKAMCCMTGGNKNISKARAQELFPSLKITHATADALLIAEYGRTKNL